MSLYESDSCDTLWISMRSHATVSQDCTRVEHSKNTVQSKKRNKQQQQKKHCSSSFNILLQDRGKGSRTSMGVH